MSVSVTRTRVVRGVLTLTACAGLTLTLTAPAGAGPEQRRLAGSAGPAVSSGPSAAATAPLATGPAHTSHAFFAAMLRRLHLPVTQANLDALYAVEHREGDSDRYNPLNVVQPEPGSTSYNSVGVQRYASFSTGVDGTVHLLRNGHWTGVRAALRHGDSTARVLSAFSAAYTWDSGITFQTERSMLDAEAVRDVGGRYADPALAAQRAAHVQGALRRSTGALVATFDRAQRTSGDAHGDYDVLRQQLTSQTALARTRTAAGAALARRANADHGRVVQAVTSSYINGGAGAGSAGRLLTSRSAVEYLDTQALQSYVAASQQWTFRRYLVEQRQADAATALARRATDQVAATRAAMARDHRTWTAADTQASDARVALTAILRPALRNSITQPLAAAGLAHLRG